MPPDAGLPPADILTRAVRHIAHRIRLAAGFRVAAVVAVAAAILLALFDILRVPAMPASVGTLALAVLAWAAAMRYRRASWTPAAAAALFERSNPQSRNVVLTAQELIDHPDRARNWIRARVFEDAARVVREGEVAKPVPVPRAVMVCLVAFAALAIVIVARPGQVAALLQQAARHASSVPGFRGVSPVRIAATVSAPTYTGAAPRTLLNPERIDAVEGSRLHLDITGGTGAFRIRFGSAPIQVAVRAGVAAADVILRQSGYVAVESGPTQGGVRLIPVSVVADRTPTIRIESPGRDLLMPDGKATIAVATSATDDFGLQSLDLRYTKVSGSGEQFEFVEGTLPLEIARETERSWKGKGAIALGRLGVAPGDALVYHVVARDRRPGEGGFASSDTFFIEVAGPGQVALEGFAMPPERDRYALSQQMIVLKIQRLRAREAAMAREAVQQETSAISAEQRAVRANFVFLMGGQVEDEEREAEQSHEIQEGRLENSARQEINSAIQYMSHAEQALVAVDSRKALSLAKSAVEALQRAFGRNRYLLRTLPVRSRVDPTRRLSGDLGEAANWRRDVEPADVDRRTREARRILARLFAASADRSARASPAAIGAIAEEALAVDPGSAEWQDIARRLVALRDALGSGSARSDDVRARWQRAIAPLVAAAEKSAVTGGAAGSSSLQRSWADEVRRR